VQEVTTALGARQCLEAGWPDVVVSDLGLPDEDGYSLIAQWRRHETAHGGFVPALALTGYARDIDRARSLAAGFQAYAVKPAEPEHLVACVLRLAPQVIRR
jgi:CheY-like chemotaxis protein